MLNGYYYYPFGMVMPGRKFSAGSGYRYGFNGKEEDDEVKGDGNQQDYGMRIYDPRLGRFLSVDPLNNSYPFYSPFHFAGNSPIENVDIDGGEPESFTKEYKPESVFILNTRKEVGTDLSIHDPELGPIDVKAVWDKITNKMWFVHKNNFGDWYYLKNADGNNQVMHLKPYQGGVNQIVTEGKFVPYKTQDQLQGQIMIDLVDKTAIAVFGLGAVGAALPVIPSLITGVSTYSTTAATASGVSRLISGATNLTFQIIQNASPDENIWQNIKQINITSFGLSIINPSSGFTNAAVGNFGKITIKRKFNETIVGSEFNLKGAALGAFIDFTGNKISNVIDLKLGTPTLGGFKPNESKLLGNVLSNTVTTPANVIANEGTKDNKENP